MLAAVFVEAGKPLELQQLPDPTPGPGEVLLRVAHCTICNTDVYMTEEHPLKAPPGFVVGHERGTEVIAVGPGVERLKVGDHVVPLATRGCGKCKDCLAGAPFFCPQMQMNFNGFSQFMTAPEYACARTPSNLSLADAALVEPLSVSLLGFRLNPISKGDNVVVLGAGPIGLAAIYWARRDGANKVIAIATSRHREALARHMGADEFLTIDQDLAGEITELLGGLADVAVEAVGAVGSIAQCVNLVKPRGSVTVLGMCIHADPWIPSAALFREVKIQFAIGTTVDTFLESANTLHAGHVEPRAMITETWSLNKLPPLFETLRTRRDHTKIMVDNWADD